MNTLPKIVLEAPDGARAEIHLHGAHVASWVPSGETADRMFVSTTSQFAPGAPIRGGVPICFPQFADQGPLPMHGFVRTLDWELIAAGVLPSGAAQARFRFSATEATRALWPHEFILDYTVTVQYRALELALTVTNNGSTALAFTAALHTYLRVDDITATQLRGLRGARYRDKVLRLDDVLETAAELVIDRPLDRVYHAAPPDLAVVERNGVTTVGVTGFTDTVVWNPGPERAAALADMESMGHARMLCVEAAVARAPVVVQPGVNWRGTQVLNAV